MNLVVAARAYILPVLPHELSFDAIDRFQEGIESSRSYFRRQPQLLGILLTMMDHRTSMTDEMSKKIRRKHSGKVFRSTIPVNVTLATSARIQKWSCRAW